MDAARALARSMAILGLILFFVLSALFVLAAVTPPFEPVPSTPATTPTRQPLPPTFTQPTEDDDAGGTNG